MTVQNRDRTPVGERPLAALRLFLTDYVDAAWYLTRYPDVSAAELGAAEHYERYGRAERRFPNRASERSEALTHLVDADWYLSRFGDVAAASIDPLAHYESFGRDEGRSANALVEKRGGFAEVFDRDWYLDRYRDVAHASADAQLHYVTYGFTEGRHPNPLAEERSLQPSDTLYTILRSENRLGTRGISNYSEFKTLLSLYRLGFDPHDLLVAIEYFDNHLKIEQLSHVNHGRRVRAC